MAIIDLSDPKVMADAIASGLIWSAPQGAIREACARIADGTYPPPAYIPDEWQPLINSLAGHDVVPGEAENPIP